MLKNIFGGRDWRTSAAHLLLLSKFIEPKQLEDYANREEWKSPLEEEPAKAISRFIKEGLLVEGGLEDRLNYRYKVTDLRGLLKERNLKVSGNKDELISRLIEYDRKGVEKLVSGLKLVKCSMQGRTLAEDYLATVKEQRQLAEEQTLLALKDRNFRKASQIVSSYEAQQVFPRGIGIDWKNYDTRRDVMMLEMIFSSMPKILKGLDRSKYEKLRLVASMMHLWGTNKGGEWIEQDFVTGIRYDTDTAARMILFHAHFLYNLQEYKEMGVKRAYFISYVNDDFICPECKKLDGKGFKISELPELPYEKCTSEMGCRCTTSACKPD